MKVIISVALVLVATLILVPSYIGYRDRYKSGADSEKETYQKEAEEYRAYIRADPKADAGGDGIPARYRDIYDGMLGLHHLEMARSELPFESITLERTGCYGACPTYKVTFSRSGTAHLEAIAHMPMSGSFEGQVRIEDYARLCFAIERLGFASFKEAYRAPWTDDATCIVTVVTKQGSKSVSDYGKIGPIELWSIQTILDRMKDEVHWTSEKEPNHTPLQTPTSVTQAAVAPVAPPPGAAGL